MAHIMPYLYGIIIFKKSDVIEFQYTNLYNLIMKGFKRL